MSDVQIFLTHKCNLNCSYCFTNENVNNEEDEFTIENFKTALRFVKTVKNPLLGIIGGEPTLHSKFGEIADILNNDEDISNYTVFTNGINIDKYIDRLKGDNVHLLINCNSPENIGKSNYEKLRENIKLLAEYKKKNFVLGINLYSDKMDYSYIFDLMKLAGNHSLRFSYAVTNAVKGNTDDVLEKFREFKPFLFSFFKRCLEEDIVPYNDCNSMPPCLMNEEEKKIQLEISKRAKKFNLVLDTIKTTRTCNNIVGIFPDLTARRSICFPRGEHVKISDFKSLNTLKTYFFNTVDIYTLLSFVDDKCKNCRYRLLDRCGICQVYKLKKYDALQNALLK